MKIKLQVGVSTAFTVIAVIMIGVTVAILYYSNHKLALETAEQEMSSARERAVAQLVGVLAPVGQVVESTADFVTAFPIAARTYDGSKVLESRIRKLPQIYSLYFGAGLGEFYQVIKLPKIVKTFGPYDEPVLENARTVFRSIVVGDRGRRDRYYYQTDWGDVVRKEIALTDYDPRQRPWFQGAANRHGVFVSQLYRFQSTGKPGVTFAKRILDEFDELIGVAGADLTMDQIVDIINDIRIGDEGRAFLLTKTDELIAYTGTRKSEAAFEFVTDKNRDIENIKDPVVAQVIRSWIGDKRPFFEFTDVRDGKKYLASAAPIPEIMGIAPTLGFVVPEDEFVGAIKKSTTRVLEISGVILVLSIIVIMLVSRLLSRELNEVALEAGKISQFDLDDPFELRSAIYEVDELSKSVSNMKTSLQSFGAYVPTDIVRAIVASGDKVSVGGDDRELTILFSDIEGFTPKAEALPPERLMTDLSAYFAAMERAIAEHHGTIDKYIGDAVMAFWNAPSRDENHVLHACRAVLACRLAEQALNVNPGTSELLPVRTRFGLHTAEVVVGNVGSPERLQYTALGAAVNLASRIEGLNKFYGTEVLISEDVAKQAGGRFLMRKVDLVSPVGTTKPVAIFELMAEFGQDAVLAADEEMQAEVRAWEACLKDYEARRFGEALKGFEAYKTQTANPILPDLYITRCRDYIDTPPPTDWNGVESYSKK
ncbi:MAG: hypothetical protein JJ855_17095 [Rhodospirillales bacterium]|nr:hypothetical protein [Rhodospirillales bacterium]